ncbi:hypothetical protein NSS79_26060 [Paenibacillus sp. FSL L8-0436]|uniref:hypothetical protein n=1 Tax=Paenibacillus sp. FSL L8-0436 TaxID=2954686 RepID=UPI0031583A8B
MKFTAKEKYALESALDGYIKGLLRDIQKWSNDVAVEACKELLASAESAMEKIKS